MRPIRSIKKRMSNRSSQKSRAVEYQDHGGYDNDSLNEILDVQHDNGNGDDDVDESFNTPRSHYTNSTRHYDDDDDDAYTDDRYSSVVGDDNDDDDDDETMSTNNTYSSSSTTSSTTAPQSKSNANRQRRINRSGYHTNRTIGEDVDGDDDNSILDGERQKQQWRQRQKQQHVIRDKHYDDDDCGDDGVNTSTSTTSSNSSESSNNVGPNHMKSRHRSMNTSSSGIQKRDVELLSVNDKFCRLAKYDANLTEIEIDIDAISVGDASTDDIALALKQSASQYYSTLTKLRLINSNPQGKVGNLHNFNILISGLIGTSIAMGTSAINQLPITTIEIKNIAISRDVGKILGIALSDNYNLIKLCFTNCVFLESGLPLLFMGMQHNKTIDELAIRFCNLAGSSVTTSSGKDDSTTTDSSLAIATTSAFACEVASDIITTALPLMNLKSFTFENTSISYNSLRFMFTNGISITENLKELNLSKNKLGVNGMKLISSYLQQNGNNQESNNNNAIQVRVKRLYLYFCGIDDKCMKILSKGLQASESVQMVDLSFNEFTDLGCSYLVKDVLDKNTNIKDLVIDGCSNIKSKKLVKTLKDKLRYNNSFLKSLFSETVSLSILESVDLIENITSETVGSKKTSNDDTYGEDDRRSGPYSGSKVHQKDAMLERRNKVSRAFQCGA